MGDICIIYIYMYICIIYIYVYIHNIYIYYIHNIYIYICKDIYIYNLMNSYIPTEVRQTSKSSGSSISKQTLIQVKVQVDMSQSHDRTIMILLM